MIDVVIRGEPRTSPVKKGKEDDAGQIRRENKTNKGR